MKLSKDSGVSVYLKIGMIDNCLTFPSESKETMIVYIDGKTIPPFVYFRLVPCSRQRRAAELLSYSVLHPLFRVQRLINYS